jgi:hypothetical protein
MSSDEPRLRLRAPVDILATIPFVMGYHPRDSVIVLGVHGRHLGFTARGDLPPPDAPGRAHAEWVAYLVELVVAQDCTGVLIAGYGPHERVYPMVTALADGYDDAGLAIVEVLRSDNDRFWSYLCRDPLCCPPEGTAYDPTSTEVAAEFTLAGRVALPDRDAFERQLRPVAGAARDAIRTATVIAQERLIDLLALPPTEADVRAALLTEGRAAVSEALARQQDGLPLSDDLVAWLTVLLDAIPVRDEIWLAISGDEDELRLHRTLWMDVVRRCEPDLVAAPGCLLGFVAWRLGEGSLARLAVDRVFTEDPSYVMARLLDDVLSHGIPPSALEDVPDPRPMPKMAAPKAQPAPPRSGQSQPAQSQPGQSQSGARPRRRSSSGRAGSRPT